MLTSLVLSNKTEKRIPDFLERNIRKIKSEREGRQKATVQNKRERNSLKKWKNKVKITNE